MKSHPISPATTLLHRFARRSTPVRLAAFSLTVVFTAGQLPAQPLMGLDSDHAPAAGAQTATVNSALPEAPVAATLSTPAPDVQPAAAPAESLLALAQDQSSSQSQAVADPVATTQQPAPKPKPEHRGLGIALATVGTLVLLGGVGAFWLSEQCKNPTAGECGSVHGAGIGMMAGGGALAATGFYFQFKK